MTSIPRVPGPLAFDARTANAARIYDYLLGGKDNFEADRVAAEQLLRISRGAARLAATDNRRFLRNAVRYLAGEAGITQFLDIGSGLPTEGNVHEVAWEVSPEARVVYVDYDPVVVSHARNLIKDPLVAVALGDLGDPESITGHGTVNGLLDLAQPVAVTMAAVLHFLDDRAAYPAVEHILGELVPGSFIVISHATADGAREGEAERITGLYEQVSASLRLRPFDAVTDFFEGTELVPLGVVEAGNWRDTTMAPRVVCYAGVGRKPG